MLPPGGRLAAVTSANCVPGDSDWNGAFARLDPPARVAFTMAVDGRVYARRGHRAFDTRLTVLDRARPGPASDVDPGARAETAAELLDAVIAGVPPRLPVGSPHHHGRTRPGSLRQHGHAAPLEAKKRSSEHCHACIRAGP